MKRLAEIILRIKEIEGIVERSEATDVHEKELDALLLEKKSLEDHEVEMRKKFAAGTKVPVFQELREEEVVLTGTNTLAYRQAFRSYMQGTSNDILKMPEARADATTATTDIGALIPETILNKVVEKMTDYGEIWARVTKTNFMGGVNVPIASAKPTASWTAEGSVAEKQKKAVSEIVFNYYKLQIRVATTLVATTVSLESYENVVSENIAEAMVLALEVAILNGTGVGQPLGLTVDTDIVNVFEFVKASVDYQYWMTAFLGKIPLAYRKKRNGVIIVNPLTFDKYMAGMVDSNGQPVARVTYGIEGQPQYRFLGKEVLLRDEISHLDTTDLSEPFLIYGDLSDYLVNTNLQITTRRYFDEDTDEFVEKSTLIADGKVVDRDAFVILTTPAA